MTWIRKVRESVFVSVLAVVMWLIGMIVTTILDIRRWRIVRQLSRR